jgi:hypothetical protein
MVARVLGAGAAVLVAATIPATATPVAATAPHYLLTTRVVDGTNLTLRWNPCQPAVTYRVNPQAASGTARGRASAVADVRSAFTALSRATGITFRYLGTTRIVPTSTTWSEQLGDAEIVVAWVDQRSQRSTLLGHVGRSYAAGTGGYSYKWWQFPIDAPPKAAIGRGYVVLNAGLNWAFTPGFGRGTTRGALLLHELGHVMGLRHVSTTSELMYPVLLPRTTSAYRPGDLTGLRRIGRDAGCLDVPTWVWPER